MNNVPLQPIIAILAGILILLRPALLNYVVALYLIIIGVLGLMGSRRF
jgi:threonine/homoserine efflux transporter RhtA